MAYVKDGFPLYYDAVNEKGLCMAGLNFPENACYFPPREDRVNITQFELLPYILCKCESVCEARELLANIISLKPKVSISLLIYQKYHSIEDGISLEICHPPIQLTTKREYHLVFLFCIEILRRFKLEEGTKPCEK